MYDTIINSFLLLFLLAAGHSLADTALQPDAMGKGKKRDKEIDLSRVPKGQKPLNLWVMWLSHHSLIHGLVVASITGRAMLGVVEALSHWIIDFFKGENLYSPYGDQALHLLMKVGFVLYIVSNPIL